MYILRSTYSRFPRRQQNLSNFCRSVELFLRSTSCRLVLLIPKKKRKNELRKTYSAILGQRKIDRNDSSERKFKNSVREKIVFISILLLFVGYRCTKLIRRPNTKKKERVSLQWYLTRILTFSKKKKMKRKKSRTHFHLTTLRIYSLTKTKKKN